jgi:hypothetical protein
LSPQMRRETCGLISSASWHSVSSVKERNEHRDVTAAALHRRRIRRPESNDPRHCLAQAAIRAPLRLVFRPRYFFQSTKRRPPAAGLTVYCVSLGGRSWRGARSRPSLSRP